MPTVTTTIPGSYHTYRWSYPSGALNLDVVQAVAIAAQHIETRPARVKTRKPAGWLQPKAYSLDVSTLRKPIGDKSLYNSSGFRTRYETGCIPATYQLYSEDGHLALPSDYESRCLIKALLKLKDTRVNLAVALGESVSTAASLGQGWDQIRYAANVVGNSLSRVARAGRSFKKGRWKEAARHLGVKPPVAVPKNWLALQYGWLPLLSDIKGVTDELVGLPDYKFIKTVKASVKTRNKEVVFVPVGANYVNKHTRNAEAGFFVRLDYEPESSFLQTATRVGLTNPLEVAWELVPFSFVVDWALPIGNWLSSLDAALGWDFKSGSGTTFRRFKTGIEYAYSTSLYQGSWQGSWSGVNMNRKVYGSSPLPSFPQIKNPVSVGHAANGFALLASVFK